MTAHAVTSLTAYLADWFLVIAMTVAIIANLIVLKACWIRESFIKESTRRFKVVGLMLPCVRWWYLLMEHQALNIHVVSVMGITIIACAEVLAAFYVLFAKEMDLHNEAKNLYGNNQ